MGFFGRLRNLRMTENKLRRCPERGEGTHSDYRKKEGILPLRFAQGQNDRKKAEEILRSLTLPQNDKKGAE